MDEDFVAALEARLSAIEGDLVRYRQGKVTAITPNLQVQLGGSSTAITNVSQVSSAALSVDDVVATLAFGNDLLVLGEIGAGTGAIPPGAVTAFAAATAPTGWLKCDGSSVLRATYPGLFAVIGTTYGSADGTHFNVPNLAGKFPLGVNGSHALASTGGAETHTLSTAEMPAHSHGFSNGGQAIGNGTGTNANVTFGGGGFVLINGTDSKGSSSAHNNMPPYLSLNFIIKT